MQKRNVDTLRTSNRLLSVTVIAMSVVLLVTVIALARSAGRERVVVIPATIDQPVSVRGDVPSESYLQQWGLWVAHLVLDVSANSMEITKNSLMKYVHPASVGLLENRIAYETERLKRDSASSQFFPTQIVVSTKSTAVAVYGQLDVFINERRTSSSTRSYAIEFQFDNGRIFLKDFYETDLDHPFKRKPSQSEPQPVAAVR